VGACESAIVFPSPIIRTVQGSPRLVAALAVAASVAAVVAGVASGHGSSVRTTACKEGMTTVNGTPARVFCGPATASVTIDGKSASFKQGNCMKTSKYISVNIGTVVLGSTKKPKPDYFGMTVGQVLGDTSVPAAGHDGTYTHAVFALDYKGKGYAVTTVTVKLQGNRTHGTFSGKTLLNQSVKGSFHC
jgi:hypothetical protein